MTSIDSVLNFLGSHDSTYNHAQKDVFEIRKVTGEVYHNRVTLALFSFRDELITWNDSKERSKIAHCIGCDFDILKCVSVVKAMLLPLANKPQTEDAPDYSGHKFPYSLSTMIICDN